MPSDTQHTAQSSHNLSFLESFYSAYKFNDWSITVAFYAAIHIVENAIFFRKKITYLGKELNISHSDEFFNAIVSANLTLPKNQTNFTHHIARNIIVNENFVDIAGHFDLLYTNSRTARYRQYSWDKPSVEFLVKPTIKEIINWSNKKFKTTFQLNLK